MATSKVSELTELTSADNADLLLIADTSAGQSKKITKANLVSGLATTAYVDSQVATKDALSELSGTSDDITEGTTNLFFTNAEQTKLSGIETGATADQTGAEIKTAYESEANTNAFTDAEKTKLTGIETGATADQTAQEIATAIDADATAETTLKSALGLGTAAYTASTDYATAAQGTTADSALQNVVEDTTPQLGGDLDTNGNNISFGDSAVAGTDDTLSFGAGNDLQIYHDGTHSYVADTGTGNLIIKGTDVQLKSATNETFMNCTADGAVRAYYDSSEKIRTTSTGIDVTGTVTTDTARSPDVVDNDGSFDLNAGTNFTCTPTGNITLTFTNIPDGQSGTIVLVNTGGHTISAAATTKVMGADMLTTITTAGTYVIGYISDGTNVRVYNSLAQQ